MTGPISHDHPDYVRTVASADVQVFVFVDTQTVGVVTHGRFPVGNLPNVAVNFQTTTQNVRLDLDFYTAKTGGLFIGNKSIHVPLGGNAQGTVRALGPWMEVITTANATPTDLILRLYQTLGDGMSGDVNNLITHDGTAVGAGGSNDTTATSVRWGWGHWSAAFHNSGASLIRLYFVDYTGTPTLLAITGNDVIQRSGLVLLPAAPVRLFSQNGDGVARNLYASVRAHYGPF